MSDRYILRGQRNNSPESFIRYLCKCVHLRDKNRMKERSSEEFISHCINLYHQQQGRCALSGVQMSFWSVPNGTPNAYTSNSACANPCFERAKQISIDRIDRRSGYIPGNVRLCCLFVNNALNSFDEYTLCFFLDQLWEHLPNNTCTSRKDGIMTASC